MAAVALGKAGFVSREDGLCQGGAFAGSREAPAAAPLGGGGRGAEAMAVRMGTGGGLVAAQREPGGRKSRGRGVS